MEIDVPAAIIASHKELLRTIVEIMKTDRDLIIDNVVTANVQLTKLLPALIEIAKIKASLEDLNKRYFSILKETQATRAGQDALLTAFADLLKAKPEIAKPSEDGKSSTYDDLF